MELHSSFKKISDNFSAVKRSAGYPKAPQLSTMAQKKKKLTKKKKHVANREAEAESDSGDFELAAEVKDDDSVSISIGSRFVDWKIIDHHH